MSAAVTVRSLRVARGGRTVLDDLDVDLERGRVTGLLGPSGCGKTTLMRVLVGVQRISGGEVTVLGEPAGSVSLRRRIGYVTQSASVYDDLTVAENLRFFARVVGVGDEQVTRCLALVDLAEHADCVVGRLSGGQRSRVSLAAALLAGPDLLVLDEPTVGLDPVLRRELWETFLGLAAQGAAVLVSSHAMDEAVRCDELILLREGRLLATGSPQELCSRTGAADVEGAFLALIDRDGP